MNTDIVVPISITLVVVLTLLLIIQHFYFSAVKASLNEEIRRLRIVATDEGTKTHNAASNLGKLRTLIDLFYKSANEIY